MLQTEFEFKLPCGFLADDGTLHREGLMRRANAADEILPLRDARVQANEAYLIVILLARVVTRLGSLPVVNPKVIEGLFATDLAYLQELYNRINDLDAQAVPCPHCGKDIRGEQAIAPGASRLGESSATPSLN